MISTKAYAAHAVGTPLTLFQFDRRELMPTDIKIDILFCGVCHSDLHQVKNEWGRAIFPMVPGHEIVGRVSKIGSVVTGFKIGDIAGVGVFVDSCRQCANCQQGIEQYCDKGFVATYNSLPSGSTTPTYGGYSSTIVIDEKYALHISHTDQWHRVAPLLCAGITTYSPIMHWKIGKGHRVGVLGLGGLGHMAIKIAVVKGAEVVVLSSTRSKKNDAMQLGAHHFLFVADETEMKLFRNYFDFIIDTVSAPHDLNQYLTLLKTDGTHILLGISPQPMEIMPLSVISGRKRLVGSGIGGIQETQEMLDFCATRNILSDVEVIPIDQINVAYEGLLKGDVRYRFVIDMSTLM